MAHTQANTELGLKLGIMIHGQLLRLDHVALKISSSILSPFLTMELHFNYSGGLGSLQHYIVGADVLVGYTGGLNYSDYYETAFTITDVEVAKSTSTRSPTGDIKLRAVSRWAYQEKGLGTRAYTDIEDPNIVMRGEMAEVGFANNVGIYQNLTPYTRPYNFYRTRGVVQFLQERFLPWVLADDDAPVYWYQTLDNRMNMQSAIHMMSQDVAATLAPAYQSYDFSSDPLPIFAFLGRSYKTNPKRTDLFTTNAGYMERGSEVNLLSDSIIDVRGRAAQVNRDLGRDSIDIWYVGDRHTERITAHSSFMRRNHLFHQLHVLTFRELEVGTICAAGSRVKMYDFNLYAPDASESQAPSEDVVPSNMTSDYIVAATHFYYDGINENGFTGTKLELAKLGYNTSDLEDIPEIDSYVEV